jgi:hypothetical protein
MSGDDARQLSLAAQGVLALLARHPFLSPAQLADTLGIHPRLAHRVLAELGKRVAAVNPRHPDLDARSLYYARATPGNRTPGALITHACRQLCAVATLYEVRSFLIGLGLRRWDALRLATFALELCDGRPRRVLLHGTGTCRNGIPFALEWDRGELTLEGLGRRARQLATWYACPECRLAPTAAPPLVLVATGWNRIDAFIDGFSRAADRLGVVRPPLYATIRALLFERGRDGACWLDLAHGQSGVRLFRSLQPAVYRLADWFAAEPPPVYLPALPVDPEHTTGLRRQVALCLAMAPADKRVLQRAAAHPFLTADALATAAGLQTSEVERKALPNLERLGLVQRVALEGDAYRPRHCRPTRQGLRLLATMAGVPAACYIHDRGYHVEAASGELRLRFLSRSPDHLWATRTVFQAFARAAQHSRARGWDEELRVWDSEVDARRFFTHLGKRRLLMPDGYGQYRVGHLCFHLFLEVELTVERGAGAIRRKLAGYRDYVESGELDREAAGQVVYLAIVGVNWDQVRRWQRLSQAVCQGVAARLALRFAALTQLRRHSPTARIWQDGSGEWVHLFPGLAQHPDSARLVTYMALTAERRNDEVGMGKS